ncbi:MAG TPA: phosphotransferase [Candidatus Binataceae bacterium]|nr:phosphotransferase [Candidatus Binataceae bacterium]
MLDPHVIEQRLSAYLGAKIARTSILASGWETTVFEFVLSSRSTSCPALPVGKPLALRFYQGSQADAKWRREHTTIERLSIAGFRVPHPYAFEPDHGALGAPFLIMERLEGGPLFSIRSFPESFATFSMGFFSFVQHHARLHKFDPAMPGLRDIQHAYLTPGASPDAPLLDRVLAIIAERVENGPLPGLRAALRRVTERAPSFKAATPSLLHMDYHPINVMVKRFRVTGIIDWVNADVGDRHLDAAMTAVILSSSALEGPIWMRDNALGNGLRSSFALMYLPLYHAMAPMDFERFRYCQAVAALLRLSMMGMMRTRGPETVGFRSEAINEVTPAVVRLLTRYATRTSGADVRLDLTTPQLA